MREHLDEEMGAKENLRRQLVKGNAEADMWRNKYGEGVGRAEELEMAKLKMQARLSEAESTVEHLNGKQNTLEKAKAKLAADLDEMSIQLDQAQILNASMEKKAKQFDRVVAEWKSKVDGLAMDLDISQKETRNASSELFSAKNAYEESVVQLVKLTKSGRDLRPRKWSLRLHYQRLREPWSK